MASATFSVSDLFASRIACSIGLRGTSGQHGPSRPTVMAESWMLIALNIFEIGFVQKSALHAFSWSLLMPRKVASPPGATAPAGPAAAAPAGAAAAGAAIGGMAACASRRDD